MCSFASRSLTGAAHSGEPACCPLRPRNYSAVLARVCPHCSRVDIFNCTNLDVPLLFQFEYLHSFLIKCTAHRTCLMTVTMSFLGKYRDRKLSEDKRPRPPRLVCGGTQILKLPLLVEGMIRIHCCANRLGFGRWASTCSTVVVTNCAIGAAPRADTNSEVSTQNISLRAPNYLNERAEMCYDGSPTTTETCQGSLKVFPLKPLQCLSQIGCPGIENKDACKAENL
ncbi:Haloacid dehalogenase-like hydrolase (HAD) superfamily protein [Dorcoceras hygrometricum]|uniref:Haloacid dehalogenase-like hydrolase (HAD) superfamily protein n=1 Tax=Dorcoceras hygrometricum TaxID=472368 RepID=A0A2Z7C6K6_9LAMI|nr:Haloacid dehalogenase-like hydrolase (HAD) superfamily protein [Dorcoceras hygrometricum]